MSPIGIYISTHVAAVVDALRMQGPALAAWLTLRTQEVTLVPRRPNGPRAVFRRMLQLVQVSEVQDGLALQHDRAGTIHILESPTEEINHFIRQVLRFMLLRVASSRKRLHGADNIDIS
eukprot:1013181-Amphidinium_carterae.1